MKSACSAGDPGSNPGLGRSPREGNGNPLQYFCLENSVDGGPWQATVHGVAKVGHDDTNSTVPRNCTERNKNIFGNKDISEIGLPTHAADLHSQ